MSESLKYKAKAGLYWSAFNQFANYGMQFIVGVFMARMLSPEDFGITALPAVFMAVAGVFIEGGFSLALIRKNEVTEKDLSTSFYYSFFVGVLLYIVMFFVSPLISEFYNVPILTSLIRVTALTFLWGPLVTPQNVILNRKLDFKTPAKISVINKIVGSLVGIAAAYYGLGLWSLVLSGLVSSLLGLIQTWYVVKWIPRSGFDSESFKYLWNFGNKLIGVNLTDRIYDNITPVFIGKYYSPNDLGVYNRSLGFANLAPTSLTNVLNGVTFPILSKVQNDNEVLARNCRKMIRVACFITFPIMFLLAVLARPLVITLITAKWEACIPYLQLMCFWRMTVPLNALNLTVLQVKGRTDLYLKVEIIKKIQGLLLMFFTLPMGVTYFILGSVFNSVLCVIENTMCTKNVINVGFVKQMKDVFPILFLCMAMSLIVLLSISFIDNLLAEIFVGGVLGISSYLIMAYLFKCTEIDDIKYLLACREK